MSNFDDLLKHNNAFAAVYDLHLPMQPRIPTLILTCVDARVDPAHFLGLQLGDASVIRTAGARVTHDVEVEIGILSTLMRRKNAEFPGFALAIIHHTDCGYEHLADPELRAMLQHDLLIDEAELAGLGISDHTQSIQDDIQRLRQSPCVPKSTVVTGYIYDVHDGTVREVVASTPLNAPVTE